MELLHSCRDHAHRYYSDLLLAANKTLADQLFDLANKSSSNDAQRLLFDASQLLKNNSDILETVFQQGLENAYTAFRQGEELKQQTQVDAGDLSLVQRDELEDELAISVIVSKANGRNSEALWKLNRRLAALRGGQPVTDDTNPFGPYMVCKAMQAAIGQLHLDSKTRVLAYKQIGKVLVISFAKELDALNQLLIDKNILPNLRFHPGKKDDAQTTQQQPVSSAEQAPEETGAIVEGTEETAGSIAHQQELYSTIRHLQSELTPRASTAGGVSYGTISTDGQSGSTDVFSALDYALALSVIQQSKAFLYAARTSQPVSAEQVEDKLFSQLNQQADKNARHKMTAEDANTVDLVGMIFRYMLDDPELHNVVKSILSHLHTPYLKLALMDSSFLDNYHHSARVLLNSMVEVGSKWVKSERDRTVLPKIKGVVETVLQDYLDDQGIFDDLLHEFQRFRDNLDKRARMVEKRNTESEQGQEKLELSRQKATEAMDSRLEKDELDTKVAELLRAPWTNFLAFNLLRHGEESLTWQSALKVVDGVVWSVRPAAVADNKADWQRHQSDLDTSVAEGLSTIGYDPEASKTLLNALKEAQELAYHSHVLHEVTDPDTNAATSPNSHAATTGDKQQTLRYKKPLKPKPPALSEEEQRIIDTLKDITFGTWFEFDREQEVQTLKLAWFSRVTSHYMFVDQAGIKQAVEDQYALAKGMAAGTIRLLVPEKKSFMERALEAVLDKLRLNV